MSAGLTLARGVERLRPPSDGGLSDESRLRYDGELELLDLPPASVCRRLALEDDACDPGENGLPPGELKPPVLCLLAFCLLGGLVRMLRSPSSSFGGLRIVLSGVVGALAGSLAMTENSLPDGALLLLVYLTAALLGAHPISLRATRERNGFSCRNLRAGRLVLRTVSAASAWFAFV